MASKIPTPLLDLLRGPTLRVRTGLWLVLPQDLPAVPDEAARAGVGTADLRETLQASLPEEASFVALSANRVLELLEQAASKPAPGGCAVVLNLDLLLARLTVAERADVWAFCYNGFVHRSVALLLVMPITAQSLLPGTVALKQWQQARRISPQTE